MSLYLQLFWEFFKTGLFAVGGGMATIPFLYELSDKTAWFTYQDLANMIAVGESTPGPIGVNMATYVGFITGLKHGGWAGAALGAVTATAGLIAPSILIILIVAAFLKSFRDNKRIGQAFYGLRPASAGLIASAGLTVAYSALFVSEQPSESVSGMESFLSAVNWKGLILAVVLWILTNRVKKTKNWHPIWMIGIAAAAGILFGM